MQWTDKITKFHRVAFKTADPKGTPIPLNPAAAASVRACSFKSAVYVVIRSDVHQYVGESGDVSKRFTAGVGKKEHGYVWPQTGGAYRVYFFEVPRDSGFRKAIEVEVMLLLRLHTGFWPIESSRASLFHQLRWDSRDINLASARAREIFDMLIQLEQKFGKQTVEERALLDALDKVETILGRR